MSQVKRAVVCAGQNYHANDKETEMAPVHGRIGRVYYVQELGQWIDCRMRWTTATSKQGLAHIRICMASLHAIVPSVCDDKFPINIQDQAFGHGLFRGRVYISECEHKCHCKHKYPCNHNYKQTQAHHWWVTKKYPCIHRYSCDHKYQQAA